MGGGGGGWNVLGGLFLYIQNKPSFFNSLFTSMITIEYIPDKGFKKWFPVQVWVQVI